MAIIDQIEAPKGKVPFTPTSVPAGSFFFYKGYGDSKAKLFLAVEWYTDPDCEDKTKTLRVVEFSCGAHTHRGKYFVEDVMGNYAHTLQVLSNNDVRIQVPKTWIEPS